MITFYYLDIFEQTYASNLRSKCGRSVAFHSTKLSPTWGSTEDLIDIYIAGADGGSSLAVTKNLKEALQHLRYSDGESRVVWADAICTNKQDISERNHQVARIADIYSKAQYSKAKGVIFLLRLDRNGSGDTIKALNALGSETQIDWSTTTTTPLSGEVFNAWAEKSLPFTSNTNDKSLLSTAHLLARAWFTRF